MPNYTIKPAETHHISALPAIEIAADALFPEEDLPQAFRGEATDEDEFEEARAAGRLWVAVTADGEPVGFAHVELIDGHAHLEEIDVLPDHGRQGLGRWLVETVIDWATANAMTPITLTTFKHLPWNAPFYAKLGFEPLNELTPALCDLVAHEAATGLDPAKRVVMRFDR